MMTAAKRINATKLRIMLMVALVLVTLLGVGVFYLGYTYLSKIATETGERVASARESDSTIQRLETLQKELALKKDDVVRASQVTADSENYAYQDRLVNDLTEYARRANVTIKNISFTNQAQSPTSAAPATGENTAPGITSDTPVSVSPPASLKKATVDITLESPLNYRDLLNFLHYIEQNLTKLKVSKVVLTKNVGENVTIDILNLEVYLK